MGNNKSYVVTVFRLENIYYVNKKKIASNDVISFEKKQRNYS